MDQIVVKFRIEKETKGTVKYDEVIEPGKPPVIGVLYVKKYALPSPYPKEVVATLQFGAFVKL